MFIYFIFIIVFNFYIFKLFIFKYTNTTKIKTKIIYRDVYYFYKKKNINYNKFSIDLLIFISFFIALVFIYNYTWGFVYTSYQLLVTATSWYHNFIYISIYLITLGSFKTNFYL